MQEDSTSLDTQKKQGRKKAEDLGMKSKVWNEGAASSHHEDLLNRPKLMQLMGEVEAGSVKHLFVFNNDRLSRNDITQQTIKIALQRNNVVLYTKDGQFDLSNPTDKLFKTVLDGIASYDNALRAERSRLGKLERVKQGFWYGAPTPFGYKSVDKRLAIDKSQSKWVKKMYQWYYEGKSVMWIKTQLDKSAVFAKRGGLFTPDSITRLLKNTHHIGHYYWEDKKSGERIRCECPAIVDETIWDAVQKRREKSFARTKQINTTKKFYLLRDLMVCGECGKNMSGRIHNTPKGTQQVYFCATKGRDWKKGATDKDKKWQRGKVGDKGCTMNRSLNIPITDKMVWVLVMEVVSNSAILKEGFKKEVLQSKFKGEEENERLLAQQKAKTKRLKKEIKQVQQSTADVETNRLLNKYDAVVYERIKSNLDAELKTKKGQLEQTRIKTKEIGNQKQWLDWLAKYGKDLQLTERMTKERKKEYLDGLISRIEVRLDKKTLNHNLKVFFHLGLVGDEIRYKDGKKGDGYEVLEGTTDASLVVSRKVVEETHKTSRIDGRKKQVKKNEPTYHRAKVVHHGGVSLLGGKSIPQSNTDVFFTFTVEVSFSNLWVSPYSSYQQFLYDTICKYRKTGWNYQQIADWLNDNDFTTPRGKRFFNSSAQSIVKKKNNRDARLCKRYPWKVSDFAISFVDKTLINQ